MGRMKARMGRMKDEGLKDARMSRMGRIRTGRIRLG